MSTTKTKTKTSVVEAIERIEPQFDHPHDDPLRLITDSATVMFLLEAALYCQNDPKLAGAVQESTAVPFSRHRDKEVLDLSSFAPMDAELFGMVHFEGVDEQTKSVVTMSLRDAAGKTLHRWQVPVSYFVVPNEEGRMRYTKLSERSAAMMGAVRETLRRDRLRAR